MTPLFTGLSLPATVVKDAEIDTSSERFSIFRPGTTMFSDGSSIVYATFLTSVWEKCSLYHSNAYEI